jgi:hypothetical protein
MNYLALRQTIQDYAENTENMFVANIPTFIQQAESRIYNSVQIPVLRKNVTGNVTVANPYLSCPDDFLSVYSLAAVSTAGIYSYLIDKDVSFIREAYPSPTATSLPKYYAIFGSQLSYKNELSLLVAPTPDASYSVELHYYYYPVTIVQGVISGSSITSGGAGYTSGVYYDVPLSDGNGFYAAANIIVTGGIVTSVSLVNNGSLYAVGDVLSIYTGALGPIGSGFTLTVTSISNASGTSWLGDNYDPVLLYGAMREAMIFMKGEADMVGYYEQKYQEALGQLKRLGDGLERGDSYRNNQTKLPYSSL